ncbi:MAG: amidoligase family protein [Xanthobacteraceae bacterium]
MTLSNRSFGIELEVMLPRGLSRGEMARRITAAGVECREEGYNHVARSHWKIVTDASLEGGNGAEIVSPKLSGEEGLRQARIVAGLLQDARAKVNKSCGFHVHVDASDVTPAQMRLVALNYVWFESFFDHIMPSSRRASNNDYINSNRARFGSYGTEGVNAAFTRIPANPADHLAVITAVCGASESARYHKLNLTAFARHRTIEFRQHSGTVEADKIEHWVRLLVAFVEKSMVSKPRPRTVTRDLTAAEEMNGFFKMFPVPRETVLYYRARRIQIAEQDRAANRPTSEDEARAMIEALNARRERVMNYARPQRIVGYRLRATAESLRRALESNDTARVRMLMQNGARLIPSRAAAE